MDYLLNLRIEKKARAKVYKNWKSTPPSSMAEWSKFESTGAEQNREPYILHQVLVR